MISIDFYNRLNEMRVDIMKLKIIIEHVTYKKFHCDSGLLAIDLIRHPFISKSLLKLKKLPKDKEKPYIVAMINSGLSVKEFELMLYGGIEKVVLNNISDDKKLKKYRN